MSDSQGPAERVISAGRRLIGSLIATGETRLRLAVLEWELERDRMLTLLLLAGASLMLLAFGIAMVLLFVVVIFWEDHRLLAIGLCAAILLGFSALLGIKAKRVARQRRLMESTLSNLAQDRHALEPFRHESSSS